MGPRGDNGAQQEDPNDPQQWIGVIEPRGWWGEMWPLFLMLLICILLGGLIWVGVVSTSQTSKYKNRDPRIGWVHVDGHQYRCEGPNMVYHHTAVIPNDERCQ